MLVQTGRVMEIDPATGELTVGFEPSNACAACAAGEGCGLGIFARLFNRRVQSIRLQGDLLRVEPEPGQSVNVAIPERWLLTAAFWVYGLPLLLGLAGAAAGAVIGGGVVEASSAPYLFDLLVAGAGAAGVVTALLVQRRMAPLMLREAEVHINAGSAQLIEGCRLRR